jgi:type I restriction enzyme M protein
VRELNPDARLQVFGQDYNDQAYAICGSDMMIKGEDIANIAFGDSFTDDHFSDKKFDYMLANPPFGVEWKPEADAISKEHEEQGFGGRFGAGLPRINDGSFLFLQHMISKMKPVEEGGSRLAIVFNGSPLFTGAAGSGESEIRRWIIENDWLEAVVALPDQLFYNTGISTYFWVLNSFVPFSDAASISARSWRLPDANSRLGSSSCTTSGAKKPRITSGGAKLSIARR